ncbi:hypothetical protein ACROYT_G008660 [Oculina patagonica]
MRINRNEATGYESVVTSERYVVTRHVSCDAVEEGAGKSHIRTLKVMSIAEKNWQTTRPTIRERGKFMFNNDLFSDVKFVVRGANVESESKQVIPAHKFVLAISSPVFEAMFYGELAETGDSIELPDCEYESLLELFRYMYCDEAILGGSNVMEVLYLAKKYMMPSLADKCTEYLQDNLDPSNVFNILPDAQRYEEKNLVHTCWEVIDEKAEEAVKSDGFETIERSLLEAVVERDTLNIEEVELFKAVNLWATKKCEEQGLSTDGSEKRRILGERIVKGIRFPVMKQQEFAGVVLDCKILIPDEAFSVFKYFNLIPDSSVGFPVKERSGLQGLYERFCSDVKLLVRSADPVIPAHEFVLSISSLVFEANCEAMVHGDLAEIGDSIELPVSFGFLQRKIS